MPNYWDLSSQFKGTNDFITPFYTGDGKEYGGDPTNATGGYYVHNKQMPDGSFTKVKVPMSGDMFGGGGGAGGGYGGYETPDKKKFNFKKLKGLMDSFMSGGGSYEKGGGIVPDEWNQESANVPKSSIDPMAVIRSALPGLQEQADRGMASAAQRLGQAGIPLQSSGYAQKLGDVQRKMGADLNELTMRTLGEHAEHQAGREQEAQQRGYDRSLDAWGRHGDWEFESGMQEKADWKNAMPMMMQLLDSFAGQGYDVGPEAYSYIFG
jgi:hypothetical protein